MLDVFWFNQKCNCFTKMKKRHFVGGLCKIIFRAAPLPRNLNTLIRIYGYYGRPLCAMLLLHPRPRACHTTIVSTRGFGYYRILRFFYPPSPRRVVKCNLLWDRNLYRITVIKNMPYIYVVCFKDIYEGNVRCCLVLSDYKILILLRNTEWNVNDNNIIVRRHVQTKHLFVFILIVFNKYFKIFILNK